MNNYLGSKNNPCQDDKEILAAIMGRRDCTIYTRGTFKINELVQSELKLRNIKLCGIGYLVMR